MSHSILTILTTAAVMLHALLGCCTHHAHSCDAHQNGVETLANETGCCHRHDCQAQHEHRVASTSDGCSHESDGERRHDHESCVEADCSYVSAEGCDDVMLAMSLAVWSPTMGGTANVTSLLESLCHQSGTESPPGHLLSPEPLRAQTQVWLL